MVLHHSTASLVTSLSRHVNSRHMYTVEPLNKGHFGDNINSAVLSLIERLSS